MMGLLGPYPTKTIYHINNDRVQGSYPANNLFEIRYILSTMIEVQEYYHTYIRYIVTTMIGVQVSFSTNKIYLNRDGDAGNISYK